ncbi:hypothetical protein Hbl1158_02930 [Halobaculum sp. CBA1158]|uniref:hypothetical protein n=1 Tax=Halobaculum sp. CBA1158 TaxID=2904243 RepID=UPI001F38FF7D|nr:hypothetical protein [Halobaculum sp. CBA1158]UIP00341.1 hypothetical protein Hbl1158_02930 [Halobaculum sp. CBA1158]
MGITYTKQDDGWTGGVQREVVLDAAFDADYTAGGESLDPADADLGAIENVDIESITTDSGYVVEWDNDAGTLVVREESDTGGGLTEVAGATDLSGESIRLSVRGRS